MLSICAVCLAVAAVAISGYALFSQDSGQDSKLAGFSDGQIEDLVEKLNTKGGVIYTTQGKFDISRSNWSLSIEDNVIIAHYGSSNDYYIPFSSIDYIYVNR